MKQETESSLRLGDALAEIGREAGLTNTDVEAMEQFRNECLVENLGAIKADVIASFFANTNPVTQIVDPC